MGHIFISYSHKDKPYVHRLRDALQNEGFETWIDDRIDYGTRWPQVIQDYLDSCDAFIVVISENSYESDWVQSEVARAKRKKKPFFPLLLQGDPWLSVESYNYVNVTDRSMPDEKFFNRLAKFTPRKKADPSPPPPKRRPTPPKTPQLHIDPKFAFRVIFGIVAVLVVVFGIPRFASYVSQIKFPTRFPTSTSTFIQTFTPSLPTLTFTPTLTPTITPFPSEITDTKETRMNLVPAGKFIMGAGNGGSNPIHEVYLDSYYIDVYEVTNAAYKLCVNDGSCQLPSNTDHYNNSTYADHPVVYVNWNMAKTYCEWRNVRLPTEAEWEKAARGTDQRRYPWGEGIDCDKANYRMCGVDINGTTKVGSYESGKSPYGIYDMAGNVQEWVNDWFSYTYYQDSPSSNPLGSDIPDQSLSRVLRGGSWNSYDGWVDTTLRYNGVNYEGSASVIGFRCARSSLPIKPTPVPTAIPFTDAKGIAMHLIPVGTFKMGGDGYNEYPVHEVHLDSYYMDVVQVTNAAYKLCVDSGACQAPNHKEQYNDSKYTDLPVFFVNWYKAKIYCEWRGGRIPTEAEWEKAARGKEIYGIRNIDGNVVEWVNDWYGGYQNSPSSNPQGPTSGKHRVIRGYTIRPTSRGFNLPTVNGDTLSFRCVLSP